MSLCQGVNVLGCQCARVLVRVLMTGLDTRYSRMIAVSSRMSMRHALSICVGDCCDDFNCLSVLLQTTTLHAHSFQSPSLPSFSLLLTTALLSAPPSPSTVHRHHSPTGYCTTIHWSPVNTSLNCSSCIGLLFSLLAIVYIGQQRNLLVVLD